MSGIWFTAAIHQLTEEYNRIQDELKDAEAIIIAQNEEIKELKELLENRKALKEYLKNLLEKI